MWGGRCRGIIFDRGGNKVVDFSWGLGIRTNNEAEWLALYHSLEIASTLNIGKLQVDGDSRHVIQSMRLGTKTRGSKSQRIRRRINYLSLPKDIQYFHILRENNSLVDTSGNKGASLKSGQVKHNNGVCGFFSFPNACPMLNHPWFFWFVPHLGRQNGPSHAISWLTRHTPCALHLAPFMSVSSHEPTFNAPRLLWSLSPTMDRAPIPPVLLSALGRLSFLDPELNPWMLSNVGATIHSLNPLPVCTMDGVKEAIATLSQLIVEVKMYLCKTYSAVCTSVRQNEELAVENKYILSQLSCHDSRMDDFERNLIELMGKVDLIREEIYVLTSKSQYSHVQDAPSINQEMVDAASLQQQNFG